MNKTSDQAGALWFLDTRVEILVASADGQDGLSVLRHRTRPGDSPPLHIHETEDEVFHVLEGRFRFHIDGTDRIVEAGEVIMAPRGVPHTFLVESEGGGAWITVTARGDFERLVRQVARPAEGDGLPPPHGAPSEEEKAAITAACAAHHIAIVGPPLHG